MDAVTAVSEVTALLAQNRLADAIALARTALDGGAEDPLLLNLRAFWLEGQKRHTEALRDIERAHALAPKDVAILNALGLCLAKLGRTEDAYRAFAQCTELAREFAPAWFNCGWTSEELGELERARAAFEEATKINPRSADAFARLAALAARRGNWKETRELAEKSLSLDANQPAAAIALANAELAAKSFAGARERLKHLTSSPNVNDRDRAVGFGLLGDALDADREYRQAFAAYSESKSLLRNEFAGHPGVASQIPMRDYVGWLLQSFAKEPAATWRAAPGSSGSSLAAKHVFIVGFPRSGTTLVEEVLACHPLVATTGEKDALEYPVRELFGGPRQLDRLRSLTPDELEGFRERYWETLESFRIPFEGRVLIDKQPFNTIRLPLIAKLFPDAKIVYCLRDPRDVVLSCFRRRLTFNAANAEFLTLESAASLYDAVMRLAAIYERLLDIRSFAIRNEALVADFDGEVRALCAFLGLDWVDEFRDFAARSRNREIVTPSAAQIGRGLGADGIGQWRNYAPEMAPVLATLNGWAEKFGYEKA